MTRLYMKPGYGDMTPKVKDILAVLETVAPAQHAESWDNPGLQVGSYTQRVKKIYFALDPTADAIRAASKCRAQLLFTHHPLLFKPISTFDLRSFPGDVMREAVAKGVSVISAHTNLDVAEGGINDILADLLGMKEVQVLEQKEGNRKTGLGRIGQLSRRVQLRTVVRMVKKQLGVKRIGYVGDLEAIISRVAVLGGAGASFVTTASDKGADLFVTGDVSHHHALEAQSRGLALIDAGHFHTEKTAFYAFAGHFKTLGKTKGWDFDVKLDEIQVNPLNAI